METMELKKMIHDTLNDRDLSVSEIPDLDLYMDQIISLINHAFEENKRDPEAKVVTKTMINKDVYKRQVQDCGHLCFPVQVPDPSARRNG